MRPPFFFTDGGDALPLVGFFTEPVGFEDFGVLPGFRAMQGSYRTLG
jgi:hypothetical protein